MFLIACCICDLKTRQQKEQLDNDDKINEITCGHCKNMLYKPSSDCGMGGGGGGGGEKGVGQVFFSRGSPVLAPPNG